GGSYAWTNTVTLPQVPAGTYYLYVEIGRASCRERVYNSAKANKLSANLDLTEVTPDLAPVQWSSPVAGVSGTSVQVTCVVTNQGSGSASGYWYDGIYFISKGVLETNAVVFG